MLHGSAPRRASSAPLLVPTMHVSRDSRRARGWAHCMRLERLRHQHPATREVLCGLHLAVPPLHAHQLACRKGNAGHLVSTLQR